jgi:anti-anti-sigma regulatory factor
VRPSGPVTDVPAAGPSDHLCWVHDGDDNGDDDAFDRAVGSFLAGGLDRGERLLCVGDRVIEALESPAAGLPPVDALIAEGTLRTLRIGDAYDARAGFSPDEQFAYYDAATREAFADGYRGLRVVAEISALAADPVNRPALVRWEHLADRFVASRSGFTAMCAYSGRLPRPALDDVTAVHPLVHAPGNAPGFQVFFADDGHLTPTGTVDTFSADRLAAVLGTTPVGPPAVALDLAGLDFVDVAACRVLARWAAALSTRSVAVVFVGASALLQRMWQLLSLDVVAPVTFASRP